MILRKIWENGNRPGEKLLIKEAETESVALGYVSISKGDSTVTGFHDDEEEIYVILNGRAILMLGGEEAEVCGGDTIYVPRNTAHRMTCVSEEDLEYLYFANWPKQ